MVLAIKGIGDATSVPFLIEALARSRVPAPGTHTVGHTSDHCVEALQVITNQDAGRDEGDWRSWYEANRGKSQEQWIREGFAQNGFPVATPPDDAFVTALIHASAPAHRPGYIRTNALKMLTTVPSETVLRLAGPLAHSTSVASRRAALSALEHVSSEARFPVLRALASDRDVDIAENALRTLNAALRAALPAVGADRIWDVRLAKGGVYILHVMNDRTAVLGIGYGIDDSRVVGFDLVAQKVRWAYRIGDSIRSNAVRLRDRLYFVSDDRVIHCISIDGKPRWAKPLTSNPDLGTTGPAITAVGDRLFVPDGRSIYVVSPSGEIDAHAVGDRVSRILVQGRRRIFGAIHDGPLLVLEESAPPTRISTGLNTAALSAAGDTICVVNFGPEYQLQCLDQETLRELWRADLPDERGAYNTLVQDEEHVYVLAQGRALAFDVTTGKRLWATNEFRSFAPFRLLRGVVLTRDSGTGLEWREPSSGEVIAPAEKQQGRFASDIRIVGDNVLIAVTGLNDRGDGLRLIRFPDAVKQRLRNR